MTRKSKDMARTLGSLPPEERVERYRDFAEAALLKAKKAKSLEQRAEYLSMAAGWHAMALEVERLHDFFGAFSPEAEEEKPEAEG